MEETQMSKSKGYSKMFDKMMWFMAVLVLVMTAGCGSDNNSSPPVSVPAVAPTVTSTTPANTATGVPINRKIIANFSVAMDPATITAATYKVTGPGATPVSGAVTYVGTTAVFTPTSNLSAGTIFTATITTGAKNAAGTSLASNKVWIFTTSAATDASLPTVLSTIPTNTATGLPLNQKISAIFSEAMDPATISSATFTVTGPGATPVPGAVTYAGVTAVFTPASNLASSTTYTATITTGAKDLAFPANALAANHIWSFTTGTVVATVPTPVNLGTSGNYVILAKAGITNVPTSAVTGDIGVSPITSTAITGFDLTLPAGGASATSAQVTGKVFASDFAAPTPVNLTTAVSDMQTAYTDAAGRAADVTELGAGDISGLTLVPGVYKWGTGVSINTDVTLSGSTTDVWIFQIAGGLTQAAATRVNLIGGALAKNVFWQVFGAVDIGTTAHVEGVILSQTSIVLRTGASVNGRLLAQTAVTLDTNAVTQPAP